jgi:hypothetical protein
MRNAWKWGLGVLGVALVSFLIAMPFFGGFGRMGFGCGPYNMMGRGMGWEPGMMGGWGLFGGFTMLFMLLIPLGFIALLVAGGVVLVRTLSTPRTAVPASTTCPNCGRLSQADWTTCPYCGKALH